jgi:hypothetical protein
MTGQVQSASGNVAVPPVAVLIVIVCPGFGVHVDAAQSAKYPPQIWKS